MLSTEVIQGLKPLSTIPNEVLGEFLAALDATASVSMSIEEDTRRFSASAPSLKDLSDDEKLALCNALFGIHYLRSTPGLTEPEFLADIRESAINAGYEGDAITTLESNVGQAINSRVLRASIKAWALLSDEERIYLSSRVLTDVRPVFGDDGCDRLLASVIVHTLKIATRVDGRTQSVFIALDTDDLIELRKAIDRALDKAEALGVQLAATSFSPILGAGK